jgi:DNA-binding MarR family transcriptional regulator
LQKSQVNNDEGEAPRSPVRELRAHLRVLEREIELSLASETGCCGVTTAQCHLLLEAAERGRTSVTELAGALELDKSTLSRAVEGLCRAGMLDRRTDACCRRQQVITLTEKGRRKVDAINGLCDASYTTLLGSIPAGKRAAVVESVALLAQAMRRRRGGPRRACGIDGARGKDDGKEDGR